MKEPSYFNRYLATKIAGHELADNDLENLERLRTRVHLKVVADEFNPHDVVADYFDAVIVDSNLDTICIRDGLGDKLISLPRSRTRRIVSFPFVRGLLRIYRSGIV